MKTKVAFLILLTMTTRVFSAPGAAVLTARNSAEKEFPYGIALGALAVIATIVGVTAAAAVHHSTPSTN